jgi:hypothetical protein
MSKFVVVELEGGMVTSVTGPFEDDEVAERWLGGPPGEGDEVYIEILKTPVFEDPDEWQDQNWDEDGELL